jgi:D-glycero-D-manno-heptose 1,7-bisphosphate phosphatase
MNKAIFLDRDGTINVEKNYLYKIEDFEFLPGVIEGLKLLQEAGYLLIIITNQSGIGRGYYTEEDFNILNNWMLEKLKEKGVKITAVYYCPHLPDAQVEKYRKNCECRKPKLGMFLRAIEDYDIDLSRSCAIGDKIRDCAICKDTLCSGFLICENEKPDVITSVKKGEYQRINYCTDFLTCCQYIVSTETIVK